MDKVKYELFWLVFTEALIRSDPCHKHTTRESAIKEAKRLAAKNPDYLVYVLETVGAARVENLPTKFTDYEVQGKPQSGSPNSPGATFS